MTEPAENPSGAEKESSGFPVAFAMGAVIVALLIGAAILLARFTKPHGPAAGDKLPFGPAEQAYAQQIKFVPGQMSQSSNLLNQEFIYVAGNVTNGGNRTLHAIGVTLEFRDTFNQLILRDDQEVLDPTQPLGPGQSRDFQVTLGSHLPSEWNQQYPVMRITGLVFE